MITMKKLSVAVLLASIGLASSQAFAQPTPTHVLLNQTITETSFVTSGTLSIDKTFHYTFGTGVTAANFTFDFADSGSYSQSFDVVGANNLSGSTTYDTTGEVFGTNFTFSFTGSPTLNAVDVRIQANYSANFDSNKEYSLTVTAVPEPETYAMFLAGLGLMAGVARRRSISA